MAAEEQPIEKWKKAYRVLDVPASASALAIKSNYRKLIKRWHPDRPATGGSTASEATLMTTLINEAYALIGNAPLRYYSGEAARGAEKKKATEPKSRNVNEVDLSKMFFNEKRIEYAVRIVSGTLSGAFFGLIITLDSFQGSKEILIGILIGAIGFAWGAVRYGDKFWRVVFGRWWMWQ